MENSKVMISFLKFLDQFFRFIERRPLILGVLQNRYFSSILNQRPMAQICLLVLLNYLLYGILSLRIIL
jgi:hypothetical protein